MGMAGCVRDSRGGREGDVRFGFQGVFFHYHGRVGLRRFNGAWRRLNISRCVRACYLLLWLLSILCFHFFNSLLGLVCRCLDSLLYDASRD